MIIRARRTLVRSGFFSEDEMPAIGGTPTPGYTLNAHLKSVLGADSGGYLEITLCGFGPQLPVIVGFGSTIVLDDAGVPQVVGPGPNISQVLWGNDQINPPSTFYCIAVLDTKRNVIQAANYLLTGSGGNLSNLVPIIPPYGFPLGDLLYQQCAGDVPGTVYTAAGPIIALTYNGLVLPENASTGLTWTRGPSNTATLNFSTQANDLIYAFQIFPQ